MDADKRRGLGIQVPCLYFLHDARMEVYDLCELFLRDPCTLPLRLDVLSEAREDGIITFSSAWWHAPYWRIFGLTNTPRIGVL